MIDPIVESVTTRANPQIDPGLHVWGWEIVSYLFLGGLVAGVLILSASQQLAWPDRTRSRTIRWAPFAGLGLLSAGMLALWLDLAHRFWAWRFYATWRLSSPMSWGAWILLLLYPAGLLLGLSSLEEGERRRLGSVIPRFLGASFERLVSGATRSRRVLLAMNAGLGVALGIYTGLLLGTMPSRPAWNTPLLGPLFLVSGISTGAAFLLLQKLEPWERKTLVRWDALAIAAEILLIGLMLIGWATNGEAGRLAAGTFLGGPYAAAFWSVVVVAGLLVPLAMEAIETVRRLKSVALAPVLILCGGLALRWILVTAGQATAFRALP